jgi:site-specific DNA-methyltransferase (adenine-specific)
MSHLIPLTQIQVAPNRQRKTFDLESINELAESIATNGLLQAPVLRQVGDTYVLVAGERRLRAMTDLHEFCRPFSYNGQPVPLLSIPCTMLGELSTLAAWEAELEENLRRVDLSWQEKAQATASLMELRQAQAQDRGAAAPRVADIAREVRDISADVPDGSLGDATTQTRNELIVSRFLSDPEVAKAPTLKEAFKILKKREETQQRADLAVLVGKTFSTADHTLLNEDSLEWMAGAPAASFDIILTDPPYGMGADEFGDSGQGVSAASHFYKDDYDTWKTIARAFAAESFRLAKPDAFLYAFCDIDRFAEFRQLLAGAGWRVFRTPLVWHNPDGFRAPWPQQGPQRKYELILYAVKGDRKVTAVREDVLKYGRDTAVGHPAQKPVPLLIDLLRRVAQPGDRVLDPFAGSGSTIEACHELKLSCTALEQDPSAYGIAVERLRGLATSDPTLF